jgi:hypothetical protein
MELQHSSRRQAALLWAAMAMKGASDQFLPGTGLAENSYGCIAVCRHADELLHAAHSVAAAHKHLGIVARSSSPASRAPRCASMRASSDFGSSRPIGLVR